MKKIPDHILDGILSSIPFFILYMLVMLIPENPKELGFVESAILAPMAFAVILAGLPWSFILFYTPFEYLAWLPTLINSMLICYFTKSSWLNKSLAACFIACLLSLFLLVLENA